MLWATIFPSDNCNRARVFGDAGSCRGLTSASFESELVRTNRKRLAPKQKGRPPLVRNQLSNLIPDWAVVVHVHRNVAPGMTPPYRDCIGAWSARNGAGSWF
jgi:hypothetical protein